MQTHVTFRHVQSSNALRDYAEEKAKKVQKYLDDPITVNFVLDVERDRHRAQVQITAHGTFCQGEKVTRDLYSAIDGVMDKIEKQLRRQKRRNGHRAALTHHGAFLKVAEKVEQEARKNARPRRTSRRAPSVPMIVEAEGVPPKPMSVDEALMQLQKMNGHQFLVFLNDESEQVNVLYRRKDGAYGLIDPSL